MLTTSFIFLDGFYVLKMIYENSMFNACFEWCIHFNGGNNGINIRSVSKEVRQHILTYARFFFLNLKFE